MDPIVLEAQQSIGAVLLQPESRDAKAKARKLYRRLLERSANGDDSCGRELRRVLGETETLALLGLTAPEVLVALPGNQIQQFVHSTAPSDADLRELVRLLMDSGRDHSGVTQMLIARGFATQDVELLKWTAVEAGAGQEVSAIALSSLLEQAQERDDLELLEWISNNGDEPSRSLAYGALGQAIITAVQALLAAPNSAEWIDLADELLEAIGAWCGGAKGFEATPARMDRLRALAGELRLQRVGREGIVLAEQLAGVWKLPLGDLRAWNSHAEHLCRRADAWLAVHQTDADAGVRTTLSSARDQVRAHSRSWAQKQANEALTGGAHGFLPAPPGACPYCASWQVGETFCTQCGSRI